MAKAKRASLSKRTRFEVFKRDGFRCIYCGATPVQKVLRADHVVPVAAGGPDAPSNLVTSCFDCNAGKGAVPLAERKLETGIATEAHREHAEQIREWLAIQRDVSAAKEDSINQIMSEWERRVGTAPNELRPRLVKMLDEFGLPRLLEAFDIVARKDLHSERKQVMYLHGILRRWREETSLPEPKKALAAGLSRHAERALAAVARAVDELNADKSGAFGNAAERKAHIFVAFADAAWGSGRDIDNARAAAIRWDWSDIEVRGIKIEAVRAEKGTRYHVSDIPNFNPQRQAYEELFQVLQRAHPNVLPPGEEDGHDLSRRMNAEAYEIDKWLACFTGEAPDEAMDDRSPKESA